MTAERPYVAENDRERDRLARLVDGLSEDDLRAPANADWTIAGVLGHIAFWDARTLVLAGKLARGEPFTPSDIEPEDVTWINDSTRPLIHAISPREAAALAIRLAEETDARVASLDPKLLWPVDQTSLINPLRAAHRGEHLDEIESALGRKRGR